MTTSRDLLLHLSSFAPARPRAEAQPWRELTTLAAAHGLASLIAYNVEYRLAGAGAPTDARDALLGHYQGTLTDNVFKLVNLKRMVGECGDRPVMLLDAAAFADSLYPHIAFRPVAELRLLVRPADLEPVQRAIAQAGFPARPNDDDRGGAAVCSDDRTRVVLHARLFPEARKAEEARLWERALPSPAFGPAARRPELEDALLTAVLFQARAGFDVPLVQLIDLRELVRGSPDLAGPYSRPPRPDEVLARARSLGIERALWCAVELVRTHFPALDGQARALQPPLRPATQALLRKLVTQPAFDLGRTRAIRGSERLKRLLAGG